MLTIWRWGIVFVFVLKKTLAKLAWLTQQSGLMDCGQSKLILCAVQMKLNVSPVCKITHVAVNISKIFGVGSPPSTGKRQQTSWGGSKLSCCSFTGGVSGVCRQESPKGASSYRYRSVVSSQKRGIRKHPSQKTKMWQQRNCQRKI